MRVASVVKHVHIIPIDDLLEHEQAAGCWCKPKVVRCDGGLIAIHNSADWREAAERDLGVELKPWGRFECEV